MTSAPPQSHQGHAQIQAAPSYQPAPQNPPQSYSTQVYPAQSYPPQNYQQESYPAAQPYPAQNYQSQPQNSQNYQPSYQDESFPEAGDVDASFADASFPEENFPDGSFPDPNYPDASFAESSGGDASFPEDLSYQADASFAPDAPLELDAPNASFGGVQQVPPMPNYASMKGGAPNYGPAGAPIPGRQVAAFQTGYQQPPQISLGDTQVSRPAQSFYESEQPDADFLGEAEIAAKETAKGPRISSLRNRSMIMVGSALLGAVALGGALAFAYKQSGGGIGAGQPPLVQADNRPVKEAPDQPGGKDFPHKNKLIYDRLQNGDQPEADRLVPRQEELAMPSMPGATAAIPGADGAPQTTQSVDTPTPVASTDDPNAEIADDAGPRRVKTMKVTADGAVVEAEAPAEVASAEAQPEPTATTAPAAPAPAAAPAPSASAAPAQPAEVAAVAPSAPAAKPKPAPNQVAATEPAPQAAPAKPASYVVQLGSKKDQTEALASFADMQQKYPSLLANYRPMVQKADLGAKGTWYRLRVGPIADKGTASKLCSQLKAQGQADCMVASQ
jgi:cell division septation protein DedD